MNRTHLSTAHGKRKETKKETHNVQDRSTTARLKTEATAASFILDPTKEVRYSNGKSSRTSLCQLDFGGDLSLIQDKKCSS